SQGVGSPRSTEEAPVMGVEERQRHSFTLGKDTSTEHRGGKQMETKLARIAEMAKADPKLQFTSIGHMVNAEALLESHARMETGKATGIDHMTKEMYDKDATTHVKQLVERLKRKAYRPQPA